MTIKRPWRLVVKTSDGGHIDETYDLESQVNERADQIMSLIEGLPHQRTFTATIYKWDEEYSRYEG